MRRSLAEDLVQETLTAALTARERYSGAASERTWLIGILKNKLIDHLRRAGRETLLDPHDEVDDTIETMFQNDPGRHWQSEPSPWANPSGALEQQQFWRAFADCLDTVPARQAQAFTLTEIEGLSSDEVCKVLGVAATNLWVLLYRARMRLRTCLEQRWFVPEDG
jgi:RNA polymerase sigma-70 factor (ECF subfamily)